MILLTVDMSPASEAALPTAIELARRFDEPLRILLVIDGTLRHEVDTQARAQGVDVDTVLGEYLARIVGQAAEAQVTVEARHLHAIDAGPAIAAEAEDPEVVLVAMATHGRSGLSRLLTGSVTEYVIRQSSVPVVVVPAHPTRETQGRNSTRE